MSNEDLIKRIEALEKWKVQRERQQITFPLDSQSIKVLGENFVSIIDEFVYFGGASDNSFRVMVCAQNGKQFDVASTFIRYTVEPSTNIVSIVDKTPENRLFNDATFVIFTTDTVPGGLSGQGLTTYYVINADAEGLSFQVSLTEGGSAVNITDRGAGKQFLVR